MLVTHICLSHSQCVTDGVNHQSEFGCTYFHLFDTLSVWQMAVILKQPGQVHFGIWSLTAKIFMGHRWLLLLLLLLLLVVVVVAVVVIVVVVVSVVIIVIQFSLLKCSFNNTGPTVKYKNNYINTGDGTVVKVLRYKSEGRWFDSRWCHWNFSLT